MAETHEQNYKIFCQTWRLMKNVTCNNIITKKNVSNKKDQSNCNIPKQSRQMMMINPEFHPLPFCLKFFLVEEYWFSERCFPLVRPWKNMLGWSLFGVHCCQKAQHCLSFWQHNNNTTIAAAHVQVYSLQSLTESSAETPHRLLLKTASVSESTRGPNAYRLPACYWAHFVLFIGLKGSSLLMHSSETGLQPAAAGRVLFDLIFWFQNSIRVPRLDVTIMAASIVTGNTVMLLTVIN